MKTKGAKNKVFKLQGAKRYLTIFFTDPKPLLSSVTLTLLTQIAKSKSPIHTKRHQGTL
jgi:hypothetical protein